MAIHCRLNKLCMLSVHEISTALSSCHSHQQVRNDGWLMKAVIGRRFSQGKKRTAKYQYFSDLRGMNWNDSNWQWVLIVYSGLTDQICLMTKNCGLTCSISALSKHRLKYNGWCSFMQGPVWHVLQSRSLWGSLEGLSRYECLWELLMWNVKV